MNTPLDSIYMAGISHKNAPISIRERLTLQEESCKHFLSVLQNSDSIQEAVILSTCNRTELYVVGDAVADLSDGYLPAAITHFTEFSDACAERYFDQRRGLPVVEHLFRVTSGLESMVRGENQIIGQVRGAYSRSVGVKMVGAVFHKLFHQAFRVGKRSRSESKINEGSASIGSVAVELAESIIPALSKKTVLMVGAGEMARATLVNLQKAGVQNLIIANRTLGKAESLAADHNARAIPLCDLEEYLPRADLVFCSTGAPQPVITSEQLKNCAGKRTAGRPLYLIDIAVPRNIEKEAAKLDNVYLYDLDGLKRLVDKTLAMRTAEIPKVEAIIADECNSFAAWHARREATPTIKHLQEHLESIRQREVRRNRKYFTEESWEQMEKFSRSLISKVLHSPIMRLKQCSEEPEPCGRCTVREVFGLDGN